MRGREHVSGHADACTTDVPARCWTAGHDARYRLVTDRGAILSAVVVSVVVWRRYASSTSHDIATVPSGVTAQHSAPRAVGRPRSSNGAVSNSGARAWVA